MANEFSVADLNVASVLTFSKMAKVDLSPYQQSRSGWTPACHGPLCNALGSVPRQRVCHRGRVLIALRFVKHPGTAEESPDKLHSPLSMGVTARPFVVSVWVHAVGDALVSLRTDPIACRKRDARSLSAPPEGRERNPRPRRALARSRDWIHRGTRRSRAIRHMARWCPSRRRFE